MKKIILATALSVAFVGSASAQNMFARMEAAQSESNVIVIEPLSATGDGFVAIHDYHGGEVGELLGMARVREGANAETRIRLGHPVRRDVIALLYVGDDTSDPASAVDSVEIDIE